MGGQFLGMAPGAGAGALGLSEDILGTLGGFDPFDAAEQQFGKLDAILEPGRTQARTGTAAGLLASGRLGSTAGARTQGAVETAIEQERQALLADQFGRATDVQSQLAQTGMGLGAFGLGQIGGFANLGAGLRGQGIAEQLGFLGAGTDLQSMLASQGGALTGLATQEQLGQQQLSQAALSGALGIDAQLQAALSTGA